MHSQGDAERAAALGHLVMGCSQSVPAEAQMSASVDQELGEQG